MISDFGEGLQRDAFLGGEGDQWYRRNPFNGEQMMSDPWNHQLASVISRKSSVLEIGCSDGRRLWAIGEISGCNGALVGVDPSREAIRSGTVKFPNLDLRVGTADQTGIEGEFDLVVVGFCLYLCDRRLLFRAVAEIDRLVKDGGYLAVIDFHPPEPLMRRYHHLDGLWSYKCDYPQLFLSNPSFELVGRFFESGLVARDYSSGDVVCLSILRKWTAGGYCVET